MKRIERHALSFFALLAMTVVLASCGNTPQSPGLEYMPDMYRTPALEPYSGNSNYADSMEARKPAAGSIARGHLPYGIPNTIEGYEMAGQLLVNPLAKSDAVIAEGKVIYTKYCLHCHGKDGAGDGPTVTAGHPPPPAYNSASLKNLPEGKMFHTITYGKNLMGPHSSQLNTQERWTVIRYIQTLQNPGGEEAPIEESADAAPMSDETAMNN
jgi:mono/diheme cytochrome c family protein/predicted small secreted protein